MVMLYGGEYCILTKQRFCHNCYYNKTDFKVSLNNIDTCSRVKLNWIWQCQLKFSKKGLWKIKEEDCS